MEGLIRAFQLCDLDECARPFVSVLSNAPWKDDWTIESARERLSEIHRTPGFVGRVNNRIDFLIPQPAKNQIDKWRDLVQVICTHF